MILQPMNRTNHGLNGAASKKNREAHLVIASYPVDGRNQRHQLILGVYTFVSAGIVRFELKKVSWTPTNLGLPRVVEAG